MTGDRSRLPQLGLALLTLALVGGLLVGASAVAVADEDVQVTVEPAATDLETDETVTVDIFVENTDDIGAFAAAIEVSDPDTLEITDTEEAGDPMLEPEEPVASDGSSAVLEGVYGDDALEPSDDELLVATVTLEATEAGTADLTATVEALGDESGESYAVDDDTDETTLSVETAFLAAFTFDPDVPAVDEDVTFDAANSSTPNEEIATYRWDFTDDGEFDEETSDAEATTSFEETGEQDVTLEVEDDMGETTETTRTVVVGEVLSAAFDIDPEPAEINETVAFDASDSTAPDEIVEYEWAFGDGENATTTDPVVEHEYEEAERYEVELTVEDTEGDTDTVTESIEVFDGLTAAFEWNPLNPEPNEVVTFDASDSATAADEIVEYDWDFDDGTTETTSESEMTHSFSEEGSYEVELEVEDEEGETDVLTQTVHVAEDGEGIWEESLTEEVRDNSPTIVDDTVYISDTQGTVYAVDADTGDIEWEFDRDHDGSSEAPTVVDGVVYVAGGTSTVGDSGTLYAIDAETGDEHWNETMTRAPRGSTVVGDTVYVSTGGDFDVNNGYVLAFDAIDGEQRWEYETTRETRGAPTVADGTVFVGDGVGTLYALDAGDGTEEWTFEADATTRISTSPTVDDGTVYVPVDSVVGDFGANVTRWTSELYALDAEDGEEVWDEPFVDEFEGSGLTAEPTVHHNTVYVPGGDDELFAIDAADGSEEWRFDSANTIRSAPTVVHDPDGIDRVTAADALIYVGNDDGAVYAIDDATGGLYWFFNAGDWVRSSPTAVDGIVYVGADGPDFDGTLHAIDAGAEGSSTDSRIELATLGHNELTSPFFDVTIDGTNAPVLEGEDLVVDVTVRNLGGEGTQTVELEDFDGNVVETKEVTLGAGEETELSYAIETDEGDAAAGDVTARSADDADVEAAGIQQEAEITGCEELDTPGVYTLTGGQSSDSSCIEITASYVELNGNGISLVGGFGIDDWSAGIHVDGTDGELRNVTVENVVLTDWSGGQVTKGGILMENVTDSEVTDVEVRDSYWGIWGEEVSNTEIHDNDFGGNTWYGVTIFDESENNTITHNDLTGAYYGILISEEESDDNVVTDNDISSNNWGVSIVGSDGTTVADSEVRYSTGDTSPHLPDFTVNSGVHTAENITLSANSEVELADSEPEAVEDDEVAVVEGDELTLELEVLPNPDIRVSFETKDADVEASSSPAENPDADSLGQYIEMYHHKPETYLDLEIHYEEAYLGDADPSDLALWLYDPETESWEELDEATLDTENETIGVNLTAASTSGPYGTVGVFVDSVDAFGEEPEIPATNEVEELSVIAQELETVSEDEEMFEADHQDGTTWEATIAADELPNDPYKLWYEIENEDEFVYWWGELGTNLTVEEPEQSELAIADFSDQLPEADDLPEEGEYDFGTVEVEVEETANIETVDLAVTLGIANVDPEQPGEEPEIVYFDMISNQQLEGESAVFSFDVGSLDVNDTYVAGVTADADNADEQNRSHETFGEPTGTAAIEEPVEAEQDTITVEYSSENSEVAGIGISVANEATGESYQELIEADPEEVRNGSMDVPVAELGGIDDGDEITATIESMFEPGESLDTDTVTVGDEPEDPTVSDLEIVPENDRLNFSLEAGSVVDEETTDLEVTATFEDSTESDVTDEADLDISVTDTDIAAVDDGTIEPAGEPATTTVEAEIDGETANTTVTTVLVEEFDLDDDDTIDPADDAVDSVEFDEEVSGTVTTRTTDVPDSEVDDVEQTTVAVTVDPDDDVADQVDGGTLALRMPFADLEDIDTVEEFEDEGAIFVDDSDLDSETIEPDDDRVQNIEADGDDLLIEIELSFSAATAAVGSAVEEEADGDDDDAPTRGGGGGGGGAVAAPGEEPDEETPEPEPETETEPEPEPEPEEETEPEPETETEDEQSGFGFLAGLLALIVASLLARRHTR